MTTLADYFPSTKKRDLSDSSKTAEEPKKVRSSNKESISEDADVFSGDLNSTLDDHSIINTLKCLEKRVDEIFNLSNKTQNIQIKGDEQLQALTTSIKSLTNKFDDFERRLEEKDKKINALENKVENLKEHIVKMEETLDSQEQYSRRNCLLIHGSEEKNDEDTDEIVVKIITEKIGVEITKEDLDRSHRIGAKKENKKTRPIIVKFARYNKRKQVFVNRKKLKGSGHSVTESLTSLRMKKLNEAREIYGFTNVWSVDGRISYKENAQAKPKVYYG